MGSGKAGKKDIYEEDVTEERDEHNKEVAYYAAGPIQAYVRGLSISNAIALTYTHKEDWKPEERVGMGK